MASELDSSTERIIDYLLEDYGVPVNVVFFRYFRDGGSEYLGRSWLKDPDVAEAQARVKEPKRTPAEWNGIDYYVLFGDDEARSWEDARSYGYVSAGGGSRWSKPLQRLEPGAGVLSTTPTTATSASGAFSKGQYRSANSPSQTAVSRDHSWISRSGTTTSKRTLPTPSALSFSSVSSGNGPYQLAKGYGRSISSHGG